MKVSVTLTNESAWITKASDEAYELLQNEWSYFSPGARFHPAYKLYLRDRDRASKEGREPLGWDGKIRLFKQGKVPAGLFRATEDILREKSIEFKLTVDIPTVLPFLNGVAKSEGQYKFQNACVKAMMSALPLGGGIVLCATGSGKTNMAGQFFSKLKYTCLFVVDQVDLLYQSQKELAMWMGEDVGVVGDSQYDVKRVTVATIQTLYKHVKDKKFMRWFRTVGVVIVDELHVQMGRTHFNVLDKISPIARYGLTATLQLGRKEVRVKAHAFAGPILYRYPIATGQEQGVLTKGSAIQLLFPADQDTVYADDYDREVVDNEQKLKMCSRIVRQLLTDKRCVIVLVSRVRHVKAVHDLFYDIPHGLAYGAIGKIKRRSAILRFEREKTSLIIANKVFEKGVNIKRVDVIYDLAEMKSKNVVIQKFGRGVRLHKNKKSLLYIDSGTLNGRFAKASRSRARALKAAGIKVTKVKVIDSGSKAFKTVIAKAKV